MISFSNLEVHLNIQNNRISRIWAKSIKKTKTKQKNCRINFAKTLTGGTTFHKFPKFLPLTLFNMDFFEAAHRWGWGKKVSSLSKICHTCPTMTNLGRVIPYLKKILKIHKSGDTLLESYWHQHFFTEYQLFLLYQEI